MKILWSGKRENEIGTCNNEVVVRPIKSILGLQRLKLY